MPLAPGQKLAHYEILAPLGAGGMGEVYRARDLRLNREVALKVLPESFASDAGRMSRFEREAQLLAALNHPNIGTIYGIEQGALVMELIEGEDLHGPLPLGRAIALARQIADALESAHEKGIIHRDLKPANIKVTPQGVVKLLDFGLAKAAEAAAPLSSSPTMSPTLSLAMTQAGMILGTAAYMSPEQARGKPVDKRADIWAFGVVFFEMLTGRRLFEGGDTATDTIAAVITREPDWSSLPTDTPANIRRLLEQCLRKDPNQRLRDIGDARIMLDAPPEAPAGSPRGRWQTWLPWAVSLASVLAAILAVAGGWFRPAPLPAGAIHFTVAYPEGAGAQLSPAAAQSVPSPDGRTIAMAVDNTVGKRFLWVRPLGAFTAQKLEKTDDANFPFWSPDGQNLAYFGERKLKRVALAGGSAQTLCDIDYQGDGGAWNPDGVILFGGQRGPLMRVSSAGGPATPATSLDPAGGETAQGWPQFLPDGRHFLYLSRHRDRSQDAIYVQELGSPRRVLVLKTPQRAVYAPPGYLLFTRESTLFAQHMDLKSFQLQGEAIPLVEDVTGNEINGRSTFAVSNNGVLVYRVGESSMNRQLTWYDRAGKRLGTAGEPGQYSEMALAPDERQVALRRRGSRAVSFDIWVMNLATGINTRVTFGPHEDDMFPVWSPDSTRIVVARQEGLTEVVLSTGAASVIGPNGAYPSHWSPDGRNVIFAYSSGLRPSLLPLAGERKPQILFDDQYVRRVFRFSPDGKWIAYASNESGQSQVYVAAFPSLAPKRQISGSGGTQPEWRNDGRELFFVAPDGTLMAAPIQPGTVLEPGIPKPLFRPNMTSYGGQYAPAVDGQRFLVNERLGQEALSELNVVLNWMADLKR